MMTMFVGSFIVPITLMTLLYILIWFKLHSTNKLYRLKHIVKYKDKQLSCEIDSKCIAKMNMFNEKLLKLQQTEKQTKSRSSSSSGRADVASERLRLNKKALEMEETSHLMRININHILPTTVLKQRRLYNKFKYKQVRASKYLLLSVLLFCIAWLPYASLTLFGQFGTNINTKVTPLTTVASALFAKTSSIHNPIIFMLINPKCKIFYKKLVCH